MVLRRMAGMDLKDYIQSRLGKPMGWGAWDYCLRRGDYVQKVANGAGSIALHATDAARFGYCLARGGQWDGKQLVPKPYIEMCHTASPFNPHTPFSLQWEQNSDVHVAGAPRDAFFKSGAGGFCLYVVPSLDLVIYRMGGSTGQYEPTYTDIPQPKPRGILGSQPRGACSTMAASTARMASGVFLKWSVRQSWISRLLLF